MFLRTVRGKRNATLSNEQIKEPVLSLAYAAIAKQKRNANRDLGPDLVSRSPFAPGICKRLSK